MSQPITEAADRHIDTSPLEAHYVDWNPARALEGKPRGIQTSQGCLRWGHNQRMFLTLRLSPPQPGRDLPLPGAIFQAAERLIAWQGCYRGRKGLE